MAVGGEEKDKGPTLKPLLKARNIGEGAMVDEPKGVSNSGQMSGI